MHKITKSNQEILVLKKFFYLKVAGIAFSWYMVAFHFQGGWYCNCIFSWYFAVFTWFYKNVNDGVEWGKFDNQITLQVSFKVIFIALKKCLGFEWNCKTTFACMCITLHLINLIRIVGNHNFWSCIKRFEICIYL